MRHASCWAIALGLLAAGCTVGPEYSPPETTPGTDFSAPTRLKTTSETDTKLMAGLEDPAESRLTQTLYEAGEPEAEWWRLLGDERLNVMVSEALKANHDLRIAEAGLRRARALLGIGRRDRFPTATASGSVNRQRASAAVTPAGAEREGTFYSGSLDASWELDLFGHVRRSIEALQADEEAALADLRAVAVSMTAEVARTYVELRGAQNRLAVARENAKNQRETYRLTEALLEGGRGTDLDLARAEAQLEQTLAGLASLESEVAGAIHRLAVLTGRAPGDLPAEITERKPARPDSDEGETASDEVEVQHLAMPVLPTTLRIGEPAELLRRRPDIRAAERRLAAQTARVGVAVSELFPRVRLLGGFGFLSTTASDIGDGSFTTGSIGPFLSWPAFDLDRVRRRIEAAEASADAALASYEQAVLLALEETENALVSYSLSREREARLAVAAEAGRRAAELAEVRYRYGADSFLTVLDAERRLLEAEDLHAQSATRAAVAFVQLYKVLGGAWAAAEAPEAPVVESSGS